ATHVATELASVPASATPLRVAVGPAGQLWLLLRDGTGAWAVPVEDARRTAVIPVPGASDIELDGASRLVVAGPPGADFHRFALTRTADVMVGPLRGRNFDGRGIARTPDGRIGFWTSRGFRVAVEARRRFLRSGHVDCFRLDSGTYQQQWGRVFVEACGPKGARVRVGFATSDEEPGLLEPHGPSIPRDPPLLLEGDDHPLPPEFPPLVATGLVSTVSRPWELHRRETGSELPWLCRTDPADRFEVYEAPVQAPPGRYLWLRLMLDGTTSVTPRIRAVRAEFPGHDLLRRLPRAYSRDVAAASFLRRYLALADGLLSEIQDRAVRRDLLLDPFGAPPEMLPWLASLVGLTLDERWPELARRTMLAEAICLFRRRGTVAGLRRMLKIYLDCDVVILESFRMRGTGGASLTGDAGGAGPQGAANAVVGFGFRVGGEVGEQTAQPLSGTAADAFQTHAHRFSVIVPRDLDGEQLDTVGHLLDLHRPAHTLVEVCTVGRGMRVGLGLHVEVSTVVGRSSGFRRAVLGGHRLGTNAVIGKPRAGVRPGASRLGTDTVVDQ
ncbi:MAG: phage tail protein, partial [Egibacteraceae bacterium]